MANAFDPAFPAEDHAALSIVETNETIQPNHLDENPFQVDASPAPTPLTHVPIGPSPRIRRTHFSNRVEAAGVASYTVYNHMLLPTSFKGVAADDAHLREHVQVWDVSAERQVEICGPDADWFVQFMTPRDLSKAEIGRCMYAPIVDRDGLMINDPIAIRVGADRWWLSIADSDLLLWAKGLATGMNLDVSCFEPDVSPLAVQGPKAELLMERIFGETVRDIRFFRSAWLAFEGHPFLVARSGWSHQGGFEIYVDRADLAEPLWDALFEAGKDLNVAPGCPNLIERIEAGLVSFGGDGDMRHNPYEMGLERFCHPDRVDCIGRDALLAIKEEGHGRQLRPVFIDASELPACAGHWPLHAEDGTFAGTVSAAAMSPRYGGIGIAMVERDYFDAGTHLKLTAPNGVLDVKVAIWPLNKA